MGDGWLTLKIVVVLVIMAIVYSMLYGCQTINPRYEKRLSIIETKCDAMLMLYDEMQSQIGILETTPCTCEMEEY